MSIVEFVLTLGGVGVAIAAYIFGWSQGYARGRHDYQVITNPWSQGQGSYRGPSQPGDYDH